jgi:DNA-binding response OmpR family regulator
MRNLSSSVAHLLPEMPLRATTSSPNPVAANHGEARPPEPLALVLLDLVLPERSGLSVLAELRAGPATAHVPVIVFSGQPHTLRDAVIQADAVIAKPFATDTLLAEVIRSRKRALDVAAHCGSVTSHLREGDQAVAPRRDEAGDVVRVPCCLRPLLAARITRMW